MKATKREILVLNRYAIKQDSLEDGLHKGDVVLHIRNDKGKEYHTTLRRNKAHSCTCTAGMHGKNCYHVVDLANLENKRSAERKAVGSLFAAKSAPGWLVQLVESGKVVAPQHHVETVSQPVVDTLKAESDKELAEVALEAEVSAMMAQPVTRISNYRSRWATRIVSKNTQKGEIKAQMAEIRERREAELANLNGTREFAILR